MRIAFLLYDEFTALDMIGPYDVLGRLPGAELCFVAREPGPVRSDNGLQVLATHTPAQVPAADLLLVPGGMRLLTRPADDDLLDWIAAVDATTTYTTSVCTGSLALAAAGLLDGRRATSHWMVRDALAHFGAVPTAERVVRDGKVWTAAGVSAGIDLALALVAEIAGEEAAQTVQLAIEYDPDPPFAAGSPETAPPAVREAALARLAEGFVA